jgi:hypothetical protein
MTELRYFWSIVLSIGGGSSILFVCSVDECYEWALSVQCDTVGCLRPYINLGVSARTLRPIRKLLLGLHKLFEIFCGSEAHAFFGVNVDGCSRAGIAAGPFLGTHGGEDTKLGYRYGLALGQCLVNGIKDGLEDPSRIGDGQIVRRRYFLN